jgi:hypothetical protein
MCILHDRQLGAVIKKALYETPKTDSEIKGQEVYRELMTSAIVLTKNFRQQFDPTGFAGICMRLRDGTLTNVDVATLNARYIPDKMAAIAEMPIGGAYLATTRKDVAEVARFLIEKAEAAGARIFTAWAHHRELQHTMHVLPSSNQSHTDIIAPTPGDNTRRKPPPTLPPNFANLPWGTELRRGLLRVEPDEVTALDQAQIGPRCIELVIGMKYLITQNIFQRINLVNGMSKVSLKSTMREPCSLIVLYLFLLSLNRYNWHASRHSFFETIVREQSTDYRASDVRAGCK